MCLIVFKPVEINVLKCVKKLDKYYENEYITPFRGTKVRNDGWLFPTKKSSRKLMKGHKVNGRFIHAYIKPLYSYYNNLYEAYAIQVKAFGNSGNELVCRALYIPAADKTGNSEATIKFLLRRRGPKEITKRYPFLLPYLDQAS